MKSAFERFSWEFQHRVILDNHYHVLSKSRRGDDLPKIIKNIHGVSGFHIKRLTQAQNPIWWNYWDYCPRLRAAQSNYSTGLKADKEIISLSANQYQACDKLPKA